ncbi:hypothetical protein GOBAR_AA09674 [Gossypium barbadense]|uniref:Glycosyl hydrolase family 32 N-terminal domain-containing protein n=1 Tax=Gossypium barbadense TaxID=3634 RepID=A0A2P5Y5W8_GOSBA|nr:hypothetical protein GOBAR_AA09674 [Gossypium barbadense]
MLKLTKTQTFLAANHERFRLLPLSQLAAIADTQETSLKSQTHTQKPLELHPSLHIDPKYFVSVLLNCKNIFQIKQAHAQIVANGLLTNLFVSNKLLYIYVQHKAIDEAHAFFGGMREKDPVSWSVMVGGFAKDGDFVNCFRTFKELTRCSVQPDNYTLPFVLRVCRDRMDLLMGSLVHGVVLKSGLSWDHFVCAALVDMYAKCRVIDDARKLFDDMHKKDLVTWTVMIDGYAECGNANESLVLFDWMREEGIVPDKITMVTVVNACSKLQSWVFEDIVNARIQTNPGFLLSKNGVVEAFHKVYPHLQSKTALTVKQLHRTGYHFQPPMNWINGPMYYNGIYHLFYQYNPKGAVWGNIVWAHSVSKDMVNWEALEPAIYPSESFDINGCWSGSATVLPENKPVIFYTGIDPNQYQVQNYAVPENLSDPYLRKWVKPADNPIVVADETMNKTAFRDPTTAWKIGGHWRMVVASRRKQRGMAYLYRSRDFRKWIKAKHPLHSKAWASRLSY